MSAVIDEKEKLLIEFMISDRDLFIKVVRIVKEEYFEAPLDRVIGFIVTYFNKYHSLPSTDTIFAETAIRLEHRDIEDHEVMYLSEEIEEHCRNAAMTISILNSADEHLPNQDFNAIFQSVKDVLSIQLDSSLGLEYFTDPDLRLLQMQEHIESHSIGWKSVDNLIDYVKRGDLFLFAAGTGGGKSVMLANVMKNFARSGKNVLYISFELKDELIAKRMDSIITGVGTKDVFDRIDDVSNELEKLAATYGNMLIKKMSVGSNSNDIRTYLMDYHLAFGYYPDAMMVDYLDLMSPNAGVGRDGAFDRDKRITEELREVNVDMNMYGFTASQLNRDAVGVTIKDQSHIAGGMSKLNTVDGALALSRAEEQIMKGELEVQVLKLRNAKMSTKPVILYFDDDTLEITEKPNLTKKRTAAVISPTTPTAKDKLNKLLKKKK